MVKLNEFEKRVQKILEEYESFPNKRELTKEEFLKEVSRW